MTSRRWPKPYPAEVRLIVESIAFPWWTSPVDVVARARDTGLAAMLFSDPTPEGTSIAAIGRRVDLVTNDNGAHAEGADGRMVAERVDTDRLRALAALWQEMAETTGLDDAGAAPVIGAGGFAFRPERDPASPWDGFPAALMRIPEVVLRRRAGRTDAYTIRIAGDTGGDDAADRLLALVAAEPDVLRAPATAHLTTEPARPAHDWMAAVDAAVERLRTGEAHKVVLARELIARADGPLHAGSVLRVLERSQPSCYVFLIPGADGSALVGASPELLVRRDGTRAASQPMAGTAARGRDAREDGRLARELQASAKNAREHDLVVDDVRRLYESTGAKSVQVTPRELIRFPNVQHLATTVTAHFEAAPTVLELCAALHPTAAVGGTPWPAASRLIDELERMERGWYAGAVGWTDSLGDGAFAVTLRCGLLWEDGVRLYAGAGVMPDSSSLDELEETDVKFLALIRALRESLTTPQPTASDARSRSLPSKSAPR